MIVPSFHAQMKLWNKTLSAASVNVDRVVFLGDFLSLEDYAKDFALNMGASGGLNAQTVDMLSHSLISNGKLMPIMGSKEMIVLNFPDNPYTNEHTNSMLRNLWLSADPLLKASTVVNGALATSGGLTYGKWVELGRPSTAAAAAVSLNEDAKGKLYHGVCFKADGKPSYSAHPIWADPFMETYPSWVTAPEPCPFRQILNGDMFSFAGQVARDTVASPTSHVDDTVYRRWGSLTIIQGSQFLGVGLPVKEDEAVEELPDGRTVLVERATEVVASSL